MIRQRGLERLEDRRLLAIGPTNLSAGEGLRTYKLALATTVEFTAAVCNVSNSCTPGSSSEAVQRSVAGDALDAILADVNAVFQTELAIRFELVPDNDLLISTGDTSSDGYTDFSSNALLVENASVIEGRLSSTGSGELNDYDIGHVLSVGSDGGLATLGAVGQPTKAQGSSGLSTPVALGQNDVVSATSSFLGILLHELGHQFGAEHSFNGVSFACAQRTAESAYEPGSGSSIMAYQGICGSDNLPVEPGDERYFHAASFDEIQTFIQTQIPNLRPPVANGNSLPTISAGADFTIPASTPFALTAIASDPNSGDNLTYSWEQIDLGAAGSGQSVPVPDSADHVGPLFRSFAPTSDPTRVFPRLSDILAGTDPATNRGEHLPTQSRELNFRVTARDNHDVGGSIVSGIQSDDVRITIVNTSEAFRITAPNTSVTWSGGTTETVTWAVAGTTGNGINTSTVNLRLSTDGGNTFPILLGNFPNTGSADVIVPNLDNATSQARLKVEGAGNVFFDLSDQDFTINASAGAGVTIIDSGVPVSLQETPGIVTDQYQITLDSTPSGGADVTVTVTADNQSQISLTGQAGTFASSQSLVFNSTTAQTVFVRALDDLAVEGSHKTTFSHAITATDDATNYPLSLTIPSLTAGIQDNDSVLPAAGNGSLVGIDFDPDSGSTPTNWTRGDVGSNSNSLPLDNLIDEDGNATTIDLLFDDNTGSGTSTPTGSSVPIHTPALGGLDGLLYSGPFGGVTAPIDVTWNDLTPGIQYDIYVFALENYLGDYNQQVTITGAGAPISFAQVTTNGTLLINDEIGSNSRTLESYAERVTASEFGTIRVRVAANSGSAGIVLPGLAIQEFVPVTTINAISSNDLTKDEGDSGTTAFTFTVTRTGAVSSAATVDYTVTGRDGNPASAADFGGSFPSGQVQFLAGDTTSQVVTLNVSGDGIGEADERFTVTLSNPSDGARMEVSTAIGTINNDDGPGGGPEPITMDGIGLYQPDAPLFHLKNTLVSGSSDQFFNFGPGGNAGWIPLTGDWDGDGTDTIGLYQPDAGLFHLKNSFAPGGSDIYFGFGPSGNAGWIPLAGDWNGDGSDTIGLYQPDISLFHLKDSFTPGASDQYFGFGPGGNAGWTPLAGDWNGDGTDTIGLYQPDISLFHLKDTFTPGASDQYFGFGPGGNAGWIPMVGDWNGDNTDTIGLYEPAVSRFHLKDSFTPGASDYFFVYGPGGNAGWTPLSGDWTGPSLPASRPAPSSNSGLGSTSTAQRPATNRGNTALPLEIGSETLSDSPSAAPQDSPTALDPPPQNTPRQPVRHRNPSDAIESLGAWADLQLLDEIWTNW